MDEQERGIVGLPPVNDGKPFLGDWYGPDPAAGNMEQRPVYKIRTLTFQNHPILGDLSLDFTDRNGSAVDTVIFAGENGTGKSTILNVLYGITSNLLIDVLGEKNGQGIQHSPPRPDNSSIAAEFELLGSDTRMEKFTVTYNGRGEMTDVQPERSGNPFAQALSNMLDFNSDYYDGFPRAAYMSGFDDDYESVIYNPFPLYVAYSDDSGSFAARRTGNPNPSERKESNQRDILRASNLFEGELRQDMVMLALRHNAVIASYMEQKPTLTWNTIRANWRTPFLRLTDAFAWMFQETGLAYSRLHLVNGKLDIVFRRGNREFSISELSSGEKQIVYRGCFLLREEVGFPNFVLLDEPEASLHPRWQKRILGYYQRMFEDPSGRQMSQIFAATHSPFIIHNEDRWNDKVIVLTRGEDGRICVEDKPAYERCHSAEAVQDAFLISDFVPVMRPTVFLEGKTDEMYFNKALEVYGLKDTFPFLMRSVGYSIGGSDDANAGDKNLVNIQKFMKSVRLRVPTVYLYDSDTRGDYGENGEVKFEGNRVYVLRLKKYEYTHNMNIGIENALLWDEFSENTVKPENYLESKQKDYGAVIQTFNKTRLAETVCSFEDAETLKRVFRRLKEDVIDRLAQLYEEDGRSQEEQHGT